MVNVAGIAVATWTGTVAIADALDSIGWRGPFGALLRHLTYRGLTRPHPAA